MKISIKDGIIAITLDGTGKEHRAQHDLVEDMSYSKHQAGDKRNDDDQICVWLRGRVATILPLAGAVFHVDVPSPRSEDAVTLISIQARFTQICTATMESPHSIHCKTKHAKACSAMQWYNINLTIYSVFCPCPSILLMACLHYILHMHTDSSFSNIHIFPCLFTSQFWHAKKRKEKETNKPS